MGSLKMKRIVIIGASIAGHTAAVNLRQKNKDYQVTLITEESYPLYDKRKLLYLFSGKIKEKDILLASEEFYQKSGINFVKEKKVTAVNTEKRTVYFKDRDNIEYDSLVIASGKRVSFADIPGAKKTGVFGLYSLNDYKDFVNRIFREAVCLVGSDQVALGTAAAISLKNKVEVKLISRNIIDKSLLPKDVEVINCPVEEIIGEGQVQAVKLKDGKAIGISAVVFMEELRSNIDFLKDTAIAMNRDSVLVDEAMRTNVEGVFACGSVSSRQDTPEKIKRWSDAVDDSFCLVNNFS